MSMSTKIEDLPGSNIEEPIEPVYYQQPNPAPSGYHQENILDANCNCYKTVLVPN